MMRKNNIYSELRSQRVSHVPRTRKELKWVVYILEVQPTG